MEEAAPNSTPRVWLTKQMAAEHLDVSVGSIDNWRRERGLPFHEGSGVIRFDRDEIDRWQAGESVVPRPRTYRPPTFAVATPSASRSERPQQADPPADTPAWKTKQQIADHLGVSAATVDRYRQQGMPFSKRSRGIVRFDQIAVDAWFRDGP